MLEGSTESELAADAARSARQVEAELGGRRAARQPMGLQDVGLDEDVGLPYVPPAPHAWDVRRQVRGQRLGGVRERP